MTGYSSREYTAALTRRYLSQLTGSAGTSSSASASATPATGMVPKGPALGPLNWLGEQFDSDTREPKSTAGWIIDLLSRPAYGAAAAARGIQEASDSRNPLDAVKALGPGANIRFLDEAITPARRELMSDVALEGWEPQSTPEQVAKFATGFGLDIATDPLTYVGAGAIRGGLSAAGQLAKKAPGAARLAEAAKPLTEGLRSIKPQTLDDSTRIFSTAEREAAAGPIPQMPEYWKKRADVPRPIDDGTGASVARQLKKEIPPTSPPRRFDAAGVLNGRYVAPKTTEEMFDLPKLLDSASLDEAAPVAERLLRNTKSGEVIPFSQRLLNLSRAQKKYGDLSFEEVPKPYAVLDEAVEATEEVAPAPVILDKAAWLDETPEIVIARVKDGGSIKMSRARLLTAANSSDPKKALNAREMIDEAYEAYVKAQQPKIDPKKLVSAAEAKVAARKQGAPRQYGAKEGVELEAYKQFIRETFDKEDARFILRRSKPESVDAAIKEVLSKKVRVKSFEEILQDTPPSPAVVPPALLDEAATVPKPAAEGTIENIFEDAKRGLDTAGEQMDRAVPGAAIDEDAQRIAAGGELDDETWKALEEALGDEGAQWLKQAETHRYNSPRVGAAKTDQPVNVGKAVTRHAFHGKAQYNLFLRLAKAESARATELSLKGRARSAYMAPLVIQRMLKAERFLRANNAPPILSKSAESGWPLGLGDILDVLYNGPKYRGRDFVDRRIFSVRGISVTGTGRHVAGNIAPDSLVDAVRLIAQTINPDWKKPEQFLDQIKTALEKGVVSADELDKALRTSTVQGLDNVILAGGSKGAPVLASAEDSAQVVKEAMHVLLTPEILHALFQRMHNNAAKQGLQYVDTVRKLSQETMTHVIDVLHSPLTTGGDIARTLGKLEDVVETSKSAVQMPVSPEAVKGATAATKDAMADVMPYVEVKKAETINKVVAATKAEAPRDTVNRATQSQFQEAVADALKDVPAPYLMHSDHVAEVALQAGILDKLVSFGTKAAKMFANHFRNATLHDTLTQGRSIGRIFQGAVKTELTKINRGIQEGLYTSDDLVDVFKVLQGRQFPLSDAQRVAYERLAPVVGKFFEHGDNVDGVFGWFFREGFDPKHLEEKFNAAVYGMPASLRFDLKAATVNDKLDIEKLANQWKSWDVKDPLDFVARLEKIATSLATDMTIAQEAWRRASSLGLASTVRHKGFVQIANPGDSTIARYLPKGAWIDRRIIREIETMDDVLRQTDTFSSGFGQWVNKFIDPLLNMWKAGMTVWNPAHHPRNFIGDHSLSFFADGVINPRYSRDAMRMLGHRKQYDGWDALRAMQGKNRLPTEGGRVVARSKNGMTFTEDEVFEAAMDRGSLPDYRIQEDLLESTTNPSIQRLQERMAIAKGKGKHFVGTVSELRDDHVRLTHFLHVLEHGTWKSKEEAFDFAAKRIREWHPDGTDLTGFERRYMRRIFPFYSWSRKAIPLIVEAMVLNPGRILVYPKATYNWAQSQGIDLASMGNPFPTDQLFPGYLQENATGPVYESEEGDYYGIRPGVASMDIISDFTPELIGSSNTADLLRGANRGALGMLSPFIKTPVELLAGNSLSTGAMIHDTGEYIDSQIPGVTKIASLTGTSPSGTLHNALPGGSAEFFDPIRSVERGNRPQWSGTAFVNYLLGLGAQNLSTPSAVTQAQIEQRNRLSRIVNGG